MSRTSEVKRLYTEGKDIDQICDILELNDRERRHQACAIIRKLSQGKQIGKTPKVLQVSDEQGEIIARCRSERKTLVEIAELTDLPIYVVSHYVKHNRITKPKKPKEIGKLEYYDKWVRELLTQGKSVKEIEQVTGKSFAYIYQRARELNIKFTFKESHDDIAELRRQGKTVFEIQEITGKDAHTISSKCRKIGLGITDEERQKEIENDIKRKTHSEEFARKYVTDKTGGRFEYVSGYINMDSRALVKCTHCGEIQERNFANLRNYRMLCLVCKYDEQREEARKQREEAKQIKRIESEKKAYEKERRRYINAAGSQKAFNICGGCGMILFRKGSWCDDCRRKRENKYREITRRAKIKSALVDSDITLDKLLRRDGYICHICGGMCDKSDFVKTDKAFIAGNNYPSIDHVVPLAKGGLHSWDNVKIAHRMCNSLKGDEYDEDEMEKQNSESHEGCRDLSAVI